MNYKLVFKNNPLVPVCITFIIGILTAQAVPNLAVALIIMATTGVTLFMLKKDTPFLTALLLFVFAAGWAHHANRLKTSAEKAVRAASLHYSNVDYSGIVRSIHEREEGVRIRLAKLRLGVGETLIPADFDALIYAPVIFPCRPGDTLIGGGEFHQIKDRSNPGEFDFRSFYQRRGIFGRIYQEDNSFPEVYPNTQLHFGRALGNIRTRIKNHLQRHIGTEASGLMNALILGDRSEIDPEMKATFIETGVVHVLAVSGLHVGYVLIVLLFLVQFLRIPWGWDRIAIILGLILFSILTGGRPSVIRASIMAALFVLAPVLNRPAQMWNIVATAALVILIWNPTHIGDPGFILSFTAVIAIIFFYDQFEKILPLRLRVSRIKKRGYKFVWGLFLVSVSAQAGTLPFTAYYFHRLPLIAGVANVFIVPLIGILVGIGFAILFLGWIPGVGYLLGQTAWGTTQLIKGLAGSFSAFPLASISKGQIAGLEYLGYGLVILALLLFFRPAQRGKGIAVGLLLLNLVVWSRAWHRADLDVVFMDVGQGDAAVIRFANGKTMLIDAGQRNRYRDLGKEVLLPVLNHLGIKRLNWAIMTHPHNDHIGGLQTVLVTIPVDTVWDTYLDYGSRSYQRLRETFSEKGIIYTRPHRGGLLRVGPSTVIQVLLPDSSLATAESNVNNSSIVCRLVHGNNSFLFPGDLEFEGDDLLLPFRSCLDSDVLKVPHHGSITSSSATFLELVRPKWALVSVGASNRFKHPSEEVLERLAASGAEVRRTDENGALWLRSDGEKIVEVKWK